MFQAHFLFKCRIWSFICFCHKQMNKNICFIYVSAVKQCIRSRFAFNNNRMAEKLHIDVYLKQYVKDIQLFVYDSKH